ncbi:serine/threonine-protein kinase [Planotetraspora silvatica]|uniref:serine/threonine-protein kinase n=1 Tax=Planotetraspora silvatica TaxID=234614 RepID=UPI00194E3E48|nr:serine/threonine-protein kinase [Planotetraspora silvatica]
MQQLRSGDPQQIGPYRIVGLLGEGGQGVVYRGEAPNGEPVAIKMLHARFSGDAKARSRFAAELAHAERVAAFCTARMLDADADGDRQYIVSEFVDGPALSEVIAAGKAPQGPALERLAIATVTALAAIHEAGIVHRDFKPSNVIMGADGPRVIDFGIARALDASGTLSSAIVGTPAYMAPEQISGITVGPAADVFAWACTIVYAANGVTPFGQDSIPAVMHRILNGEPDLGPLSGPLRDIVAACLAKDPARRPTARAILLRLIGGKDMSADTLLMEGAQFATAPASPYTLPLPGDAAPKDAMRPAGPSEPTRPVARGPASSPGSAPARSRTGGLVMATLIVVVLLGGAALVGTGTIAAMPVLALLLLLVLFWVLVVRRR